MQREKGWRAPGSHVGRPHGGDQRRERQERTLQRAISRGDKKTAAQIVAARARAVAS